MILNKIIIIFFIIIFPNQILAHTNHYKDIKKIKMEIFRNDKLIGYNNYFFKRKEGITEITNQIKFTVNLLGAKIFIFESYGIEKYKNNQLISFNSKTIQNNKKKFVNLSFNKKDNKFIIEGSSFNGTTNSDSVIANWWNHKMLQVNTQISPISGSLKEQTVQFISKEKISIYGQTFDTEHFRLLSKNPDISKNKKLDFHIWYDKKTGLILKVKYKRMGNWEYRLKSFE
mgnify:CR=1 FL=1|jgi:hypothetical protein